MTPKIFALTAGSLLLAAACVAPEDRAMYRDGAYINEGAGLKAFADAVVSHCAPAIEGSQDFSKFEKKGATPIRALADNKIPVVSSDSLPVWQLAEGVVQMQLDPYSACEVVAVGLPPETAVKVIARTAKANGFRETELAADSTLEQRLVSGQGTAIEITGAEQGQTPDGRTYTKVTATVRAAG